MSSDAGPQRPNTEGEIKLRGVVETDGEVGKGENNESAGAKKALVGSGPGYVLSSTNLM